MINKENLVLDWFHEMYALSLCPSRPKMLLLYIPYKSSVFFNYTGSVLQSKSRFKSFQIKTIKTSCSDKGLVINLNGFKAGVQL